MLSEQSAEDKLDDVPSTDGAGASEETDEAIEEEDDEWSEWEFQELGNPTAPDPTGGWFGSLREIFEEIAAWAGCRRVWESVAWGEEELLEKCPSCTVESREYDSGYPGGSDYDFMVRTLNGPTFRKEFRREVLALYRSSKD